jgi:hypothetical protein
MKFKLEKISVSTDLNTRMLADLKSTIPKEKKKINAIYNWFDTEGKGLVEKCKYRFMCY